MKYKKIVLHDSTGSKLILSVDMKELSQHYRTGNS